MELVMKTRNIVLAFLTLMAVGCAKEQPAGNENIPATGKTIVVNMPEMTKVALGEQTQTTASLVWSKGDEIAVIEGKGTSSQKYSVYRLVGEGGTTSGTFEYVSGNAAADVITDVVFPASAVENGYAVPTAQTYVEGSFDTDAMVMSWTRTAEGEGITLSHEAAALMFTVTGAADQKISSVAVTCGEKTYTLACAEPVAISSEGKVFHVAVPGSTVSQNYAVVFTTESGNTLTKNFTYALNAGKIGRLPAFAFETAPAVEPLKVGDYFGGGIVFEIGDGYAKVVSLDEGNCAWAKSGAASTHMGTEANPQEGAANTDIFRNRADLENYPAVAWCIAKGEGWYLPSRVEINDIVNGLGLSSATLDSINEKFVEYFGQGFVSGKALLTSCEHDSDATKVWTVTIPAKSHNAYTKTPERPVRAVKKIALVGGETADPKPSVSTVITNLTPTKDASLASSVSGSHTKGTTGPELAVRYSSSSQYRMGTFFQFDISNIKESCIGAFLNLSFHTNKMADTNVDTMQLEIRESTEYVWDETEDRKWLTTNDSDIMTVTVKKGDTNISLDLTNLVKTCLDKGQEVFQIRIRAKEVDGNKNKDNILYIYSKEHETESLRPYLQVTTLK